MSGMTDRPHGACTEKSRVLQSPVNVVSEGESGGGKEYLAESSSAERMSGKRETILKTEDSMLSKFNTIGVMSLIVVALLLLCCFAGSTAYADGGGGQWPDEVPPQPTGGGDGCGGDGSSIIVTITTILGVIL